MAVPEFRSPRNGLFQTTTARTGTRGHSVGARWRQLCTQKKLLRALRFGLDFHLLHRYYVEDKKNSETKKKLIWAVASHCLHNAWLHEGCTRRHPLLFSGDLLKQRNYLAWKFITVNIYKEHFSCNGTDFSLWTCRVYIRLFSNHSCIRPLGV